ncbi:MAG: hypothetical protein MZV64_63985 [Ignavibacteriales bacterium]|nr:hypothetical protein [Ignavibacteriales bacterium]
MKATVRSLGLPAEVGDEGLGQLDRGGVAPGRLVETAVDRGRDRHPERPEELPAAARNGRRGPGGSRRGRRGGVR